MIFLTIVQDADLLLLRSEDWIIQCHSREVSASETKQITHSGQRMYSSHKREGVTSDDGNLLKDRVLWPSKFTYTGIAM